MRKSFEKPEEEVLDNSDSDVYSLDNLDLLNLRISFSTDTNDIKKLDNKKDLCKSKNNHSEILCRGDDLHQKGQLRKQRKISGSICHQRSVFEEASLEAAGDCRPVIKTTSHFATKCETFHDQTISSKNAESLRLLYKNRDEQHEGKHFCRPSDSEVSLECFRGRRHTSNIQTINIHTISSNTPMAQRSVKNSQNDTSTPESVEGTFPFKVTPSGNFKVNSHQVVFESQKLSVLVADPERTKVNIHPENFAKSTKVRKTVMAAQENTSNRKNVMETIVGGGGLGGSLGSLIASTAPVRREKESTEYEGKVTEQILDPELNLRRLGYTSGDPIDWQDVKLPEKKNLYLELYQRITNYTNADCKVYIDNEEFNCHLIVLQCYSKVFDEYVAVKKVELPSDKVSTSAFAFIYEWMITGEPAYTDLNRETVLEVFTAANYLKIKDLTEQCWAFIDNVEVFAEDTAFLLYMDAKLKNLDDVRELMLPRIQKFFLMLVSSEDWVELEKNDVMNFLNSNYICVNCEMEIFMSAVRWLKHRWEERQNDILDVMGCVRFGNIAPWQLVDIKRNPENPEFLKLTSMPAICKMIDDGLAFVIIKYWYGHENDDFQHWNNILGLQEPPSRNWSGMDKTYFTYREFLIYLDQYRRSQMMDRTRLKDTKKKTGEPVIKELSPSINYTQEKTIPNMPTMDQFLGARKQATEVIPRQLTRQMDKNTAATIIQSVYRGFAIRKMLREVGPQLQSSGGYGERTLNYWATQKNLKVLAMFNSCKMSSPNAPRREYLVDTSLFSADRESVLVFGGLDPHNTYGTSRNTGKDVFRYLPDNNVWEYVGDLPEPRHHHSVAFLRGRVYLCGGADPRDDDIRGKSVVVDTVWSFEPVKRCWYIEGSLCTPRKNFGLVASNFSMFAIGGQDQQGRTLASVERFVPETGSWEFQAPLRTPRMGVACTKYRDKIWAAGGMSGSKRVPLCNHVECYDIRNNQWTEISTLRFPRCFGRLFSMSDRLYLIGGAGKTTNSEKSTRSVSAVDVWDPVEMKWNHHTDMAIPRHGHAIAYLGTQILIIGGVTTVYMRALSNTECYCTERSTWVRGIACLPTTLSGHAAVTLPPASLL